MSIGQLTQLEIYQGILSLTIAIIGILISLRIISKYFQFKRKELLGVAFAILLLSISWTSSGISFLLFISSGVLLNDTLYIFIAYGLILFASLFMMYAIVSLVYPDSMKKIVLTFFGVCIIFEIIFLYLLFTNSLAVGEKTGKFDVEARGISVLMVIIALIISLITRILIIKSLIKSDNKKVIWKGRFLLIEFILLVIMAFFDILFSLTLTTLIIARIIIVCRFIFVYLGWLLPDRLANWLVKEKE